MKNLPIITGNQVTWHGATYRIPRGHRYNAENDTFVTTHGTEYALIWCRSAGLEIVNGYGYDRVKWLKEVGA